MDWYDIGESCGGTTDQGLARIRVERALAIGVHTDILFPLQQQQQVADGLRAGGAQSHFLPLESPQGHDAFLVDFDRFGPAVADRSEEHTSELQSLMRISYAVFCLKTKTNNT